MAAASLRDRRTEPRLAPAVPVVLSFPGSDQPDGTAVLRDLSAHGMYLETPMQVPFGGSVRARFVLAGTRATLAEGRVVRTERARGLAIELVHMGESLRTTLDVLQVVKPASLDGVFEAFVEIRA